ncbi:TlpA family protein disulfide reductase [Glaciecola petra]|uniref:TlpA disulfide reductase family protein n=1 Tax=Glaciecola petra TaxID=3075602 RepID=A0ABU2ZNU8_9ALTE|nr:TlpA disulfide reductase family protein [Aestuariibacter sp. P117]MDT0594299.1 TlpA disulfide reductase family protein [Aestuariibacter sp. P117]
MNKRIIIIVGFCLVIVAFCAGLALNKAFEYDLKTLNGEKFTFAQLNEKIVIVNYFAEWCAPCLKEIPELNLFNAQSPDNVILFAVSYDALSNEQLNNIKNKYDIQFPLIVEQKNAFPIERPAMLPATFIIKPGGKLAGQLLGEQTAETLNEAVSSL